MELRWSQKSNVLEGSKRSSTDEICNCNRNVRSRKKQCIKDIRRCWIFCVDNLPVALLDKFADMLLDETAKIENVALGIDIRNGRGIGELAHKLKEIEAAGISMRFSI